MRPNWLLAAVLCLSGDLAHAQTATESQATPAPTARAFARLPTYEKVELSPDGRHLALTARVDGAMVLGVVNLAGMKPVSALRFSRGSTVANFHWSAPNRIITEMGTEDGFLAQPLLTGELFAMDLDGKNKTLLYSYRSAQFTATGTRITSKLAPTGYAYVEDPLIEDPATALVRIVDTEGYAGLYRLSETTGDTGKLASAPMRYPWRYFVDRLGRPRLVWGTADQADTPVIYRREGDTWQPLMLKGRKVTPKLVSADGKLAYFEIEAADGGECLVEWDSSTPEKPVRELLCKPRALLGNVLTDAAGRPCAVEIGEGGLAVIDEGAIEVQVLRSLQEQFPGQIVKLVSNSRDHRVLLYRVFSDRNSGELYVFDVASGKARFLDAYQSWLDPEQMAEQRRIEVKSRDGLALHGLVTLPPGKGEQKLPLVVFPHGGPIGQLDRWGWNADAQFLASRGYAVLQVNFRGSGGYGDAFQKAGYREWGGKMIDDITDSVRALISNGTADAGRICIYGGSYGGYAALMSAVREPELYRCAIGYAGVYDLPLLFGDSDVTESQIGKRYWQDSIGKDPAFLEEQSPVNRLDSLRAAIMIVHGKEDFRAPYSQAKSLRDALERRKIPYEWLVKDNEMHGFYDEANRTELFEKIGAFVDRHIGAGAKK